MNISILLTIFLFVSDAYSKVLAQDSAKQDFVSRTEIFFKESAKKSLQDIETDKAAIRQNQVIEEIEVLSRQARSFLKKGFDTVALIRDLNQVSQWHNISKDGVFENKGTTQTSRNLTTTYHILDALHAEVSIYKKRVDRYLDQLVRYRFQIDSLCNDKSLFILSKDSTELNQYIHKLKVVAVEITPVTTLLKDNINTIQTIQNQVNFELLQLQTGMEEIEYDQQQISDKTFQQEFLNLWEESNFDRPIHEVLYFSALKAKLVFFYYLKGHWGKIILSVLLLLLVTTYLHSLRSGIRNINNKEEVKSMLLSSPFLSGIVITLSVAQFLFPNPPFIFTAGIVLVSALMITIIFRKEISKYWLGIWVIFVVLFAFVAVDNLVLQASRPERWLMVILAMISFVTGIFILFNKERHQELRERWILIPIFLMTIMELFSILFNVLGRFNIAKILMVAGLMNVVVAIVFLWVIRLVNEGLTYASNLYKKQERRLFYINYNRVGKRAPFFFYAILIVGWFVLFGRNFYEFRLLSEPLKSFFQEEHQLGSYTFSIYNLLIFMLIMIGATVLSKIVSFFASDSQWNSNDDKQEKKFRLGSWILLIRISIISIGFFLAFAAAGIPVDQIMLVIGALGVGIGFGLQSLVNNLVSGLIIAFEKPVNVDDLIEIDGHAGKVKSIGFRSSVIATLDGADLIMPNGDLLNSNVLNWTVGGFKKRIHIQIEVKYGSDLDKVKMLIVDVLHKNDQIFATPAVSVQFGSLSAQSIMIEIYFWVKTLKDTGQVRSDVIKTIQSVFQENGVDLALPKQELLWKNEPESNNTID
ncbi:mechanosensitive ion channel [Sphingobacterium sp. UDSM-2020]|uniref:Mechanosensitive ion channel domain-containing protein n=1 Tax=Sphingobacterium kitahiroshimense TaxID=470446 RepID=A0ABV0BLW4_9SPHI|nr:mechanosensitive ion channel domain-containing protein [Sphingobacterium sp. UDSM-2020]QQD13959.1 mechanosensitive ion channel [Sphingobacterium sp. UDSM-2020]